MEADVDGRAGAGRHERADGRTTGRHGHRDRCVDTRLGTLNLKVPKLRQGSYFPRVLVAAPPLGEGAGRCDPGGLDRRRLDTQGGRPCSGFGPRTLASAGTTRWPTWPFPGDTARSCIRPTRSSAEQRGETPRRCVVAFVGKTIPRIVSRSSQFPNEASILRLIGAVPFERNDEWQTSSRLVMVEAFAQIDPLLGIAIKAA